MRKMLGMVSEIELPPPTPDDEPFTPESLRELLLGSQQRDKASLRQDFCQEYGGERRPGPLRLFVGARRLFALQLYLLLVCVASGKPWDKAMSGSSWAMALDQVNAGAESKVSRNWAWMAENNLVRTERKGRHLHVTRLQESGTGEEYTQPRKGFFYVPFAYFTEGWHRKLSLAGTTALLIARSRSPYKPWFELPLERGPEWYGISADTLKSGFDELQVNGLLRVHQRSVRDHRARFGTKRVNQYALLESFITPQRIRPEDQP
jgi:hypothetical protein